MTTKTLAERLRGDLAAVAGSRASPEKWERFCISVGRAITALDAKDAEIARLTEALRWYADEANWKGRGREEPCETHRVFAFQSGPARRDGGRVARAALSE